MTDQADSLPLCPSRHGTFVAYQPQYLKDSKWIPIPIRLIDSALGGAKFPLIFGGICQEIWLCGEAQANAIAWGFAAEWEAVNPSSVHVRIVSFDVKFNIEAKVRESNP